MRTIYLRNVPEEVAANLERLASRAGMSLNAFTVRELCEVSRSADNAELLDGLPDVGVGTAALVEALDASRAVR